MHVTYAIYIGRNECAIRLQFTWKLTFRRHIVKTLSPYLRFTVNDILHTFRMNPCADVRLLYRRAESIETSSTDNVFPSQASCTGKHSRKQRSLPEQVISNSLKNALSRTVPSCSGGQLPANRDQMRIINYLATTLVRDARRN